MMYRFEPGQESNLHRLSVMLIIYKHIVIRSSGQSCRLMIESNPSRNAVGE